MLDNIHDASLAPATILLNPGEKYAPSTRKWQGIPGIECTDGGRLFATWYSGGEGEGPENYVLVQSRASGAAEWEAPLLVIDPPGKVRAFDPVLWIDPLQRLWLFWAQSFQWYNGRAGVWFIRCDAPDADRLAWTEPRRIANGVMMNKPTFTSANEWLFPCAVWKTVEPVLPELEREAVCGVVVSWDQGETFAFQGGADVPWRSFDEHMVVEKNDGALWLLARTRYGIGQSHSSDRGVTWTHGYPAAISGPDSRFHIRRLPRGRLLLLNHYQVAKRSHLTASLSDDDGLSWTSHLLLDERETVSYPDVAISADGAIHVIYDRDRNGVGDILHAKITEAEILSGSVTHEGSFTKQIINTLPKS
jgi:hypothetical protein